MMISNFDPTCTTSRRFSSVKNLVSSKEIIMFQGLQALKDYLNFSSHVESFSLTRCYTNTVTLSYEGKIACLLSICNHVSFLQRIHVRDKLDQRDSKKAHINYCERLFWYNKSFLSVLLERLSKLHFENLRFGILVLLN